MSEGKIGRRGFIGGAAAALAGMAAGVRVAFGRPRVPDVLDWRNGGAEVYEYDIVDPVTGESHPNGDIFYADARRGVVRLLLRNDRGYHYFAADKGRGPVVQSDTPWRKRVRLVGGREVEVPTVYVVEPDGSRRYVPVDDVDLAWAEAPAAFRIVRKPA